MTQQLSNRFSRLLFCGALACLSARDIRAQNSPIAVGGQIPPPLPGVSYQGTVVPGAPVAAVSGNRIQSLTPATACTTGFNAIFPAICATVTLTNQSLAISNANLQCGGAICPAGLYRIAMYEWTTSGPPLGSTPPDVSLGWSDTAQAQTYDLSGGAYQTSGTTGVGSYIGSVAYVYSGGTANLTYSVGAAPTGSAGSIIVTVERLL
jgi:hypothetical protein